MQYLVQPIPPAAASLPGQAASTNREYALTSVRSGRSLHAAGPGGVSLSEWDDHGSGRWRVVESPAGSKRFQISPVAISGLLLTAKGGKVMLAPASGSADQLFSIEPAPQSGGRYTLTSGGTALASAPPAYDLVAQPSAPASMEQWWTLSEVRAGSAIGALRSAVTLTGPLPPNSRAIPPSKALGVGTHARDKLLFGSAPFTTASIVDGARLTLVDATKAGGRNSYTGKPNIPAAVIQAATYAIVEPVVTLYEDRGFKGQEQALGPGRYTACWRPEPGQGERLAVGPNDELWVVLPGGDIRRRVAGTWASCPKQAADLAVGTNGAVWMVEAGSGLLHEWSPGTGTWQATATHAARVAVDSTGAPWIITPAGRVQQLRAGVWLDHEAVIASDITIAPDNHAWIVGRWDDRLPMQVHRRDSTGLGLNRWTPVGDGWEDASPSGVALAVDGRGRAWVSRRDGRIWRQGANRWHPVAGRATDLASSPAGVIWMAGGVGVGGGPELFRRAGFGVPAPTASSIRVPFGVIATVFTEERFAGESLVYTSDGDLPAGFDDAAASIVVRLRGAQIPAVPLRFGDVIDFVSSDGWRMEVKTNNSVQATPVTGPAASQFIITRVGPTRLSTLVSYGDEVALHTPSGAALQLGAGNRLEVAPANPTSAAQRFQFVRIGDTASRTFVSALDALALGRPAPSDEVVVRTNNNGFEAQRQQKVSMMQAALHAARDRVPGSPPPPGCAANLCGAAACTLDAALLQVCGGDVGGVVLCGVDIAGLSACGTKACGGAVSALDACGADACVAAACVAAACGVAACGAFSGVLQAGNSMCIADGDVVSACGTDVGGVDACALEACGAAACGLNLCPANVCAADVCGLNIFPFIPFI